MEKPAKEKASKMAFDLIDSGSAEAEVVNILTSQGFTAFEIELLMQPIVEKHVLKKFKQFLWGTIFLTTISVACFICIWVLNFDPGGIAHYGYFFGIPAIISLEETIRLSFKIKKIRQRPV